MRRQLANFSPIRGSQTVCDLSGRDSALAPRTNGVCEPRMRRRSKAPPCESLPSVCNRPVFRMPPPYARQYSDSGTFRRAVGFRPAPNECRPTVRRVFGRLPEKGLRNSRRHPRRQGRFRVERSSDLPFEHASNRHNRKTHVGPTFGRMLSVSLRRYSCGGGDAGRNTPPFPALLTGCGRGRRPLHGISYIVICACTIPPALPLFRVPNVPPPFRRKRYVWRAEAVVRAPRPARTIG